MELRKEAELGASADHSADTVTGASPEMLCEVQLGNGGSWEGGELEAQGFSEVDLLQITSRV